MEIYELEAEIRRVVKEYVRKKIKDPKKQEYYYNLLCGLLIVGMSCGYGNAMSCYNLRRIKHDDVVRINKMLKEELGIKGLPDIRPWKELEEIMKRDHSIILSYDGVDYVLHDLFSEKIDFGDEKMNKLIRKIIKVGWFM